MKNVSVPTAMLSVDEQEAVRRQLAHISASLLFRNSKRFPDFLRYTVEETLSGNFEQLKERMLGVEVFGRDPSYDTNSDPVVRMTAVEVRKRLAQYYQAPGRENELRIEFPRGSYVPEFRFPEMIAEPPPVENKPPAESLVTDSSRRRYWVAALALSCVVVFFVAWKRPPALGTSFDRFWAPIVSSSSPVLVCVPDLTSTAPPAPTDAHTASPPDPVAGAIASLPVSFKRNRVSFGDFFAASTLTGVLGGAGRPFRLRRANDANLQDLEEGPVVLIGGRSSNQWSLKLDDQLRFGAVWDGSFHYVSDRQNPSSRQWGVTRSTDPSDPRIKSDYAIISRVSDPTTGHPLLTAAGLFQYGTEAAAMCLSTPACLADAERMAPGDWRHKNIQIVIETTIIGENAGQPRILAAYLW